RRAGSAGYPQVVRRRRVLPAWRRHCVAGCLSRIRRLRADAAVLHRAADTGATRAARRTPRMRWAALSLVACSLQAADARGELWAYVDEQGHSHIANRQLDARYQLFFKGATTLDVPSA